MRKSFPFFLNPPPPFLLISLQSGRKWTPPPQIAMQVTQQTQVTSPCRDSTDTEARKAYWRQKWKSLPRQIRLSKIVYRHMPRALAIIAEENSIDVADAL